MPSLGVFLQTALLSANAEVTTGQITADLEALAQISESKKPANEGF